MNSMKGTPTKNMNETDANNYQNMKEKLDILEKEYGVINEEIASNLKTFDVFDVEFRKSLLRTGTHTRK